MRTTFLKAVIGVAAWLFYTAALVRADSTPPPNDSFASATVMSGQFWFTQGSLYGATSEANEPVLTGYPNGPTIWYRWTAPVTGPYRITTFGSEKTTILAVYSGATIDATRLLGYKAIDDSFTNAAAVTFTATAGQSYSFQVLGADYSSPTFISNPFLPSRIQLSLTPVPGSAFVPANDNFANATVLTGSTADVVVDDATATSESAGGEPGGLADARGNTVWLAWTAPSTGTWQVDTTQGDHDTITAVYTGSALNALTRADYSDDDSAPNPSGVRGGRVTIRAAAGVVYRIQIQGATSAGAPPDYGCVRVMLQPVQAPANDDFANALTLTGSAPTGDGWTTFATREAGEPAASPDQSRSAWWQWTAPSTGLLAVVSYQGSVDVYTGGSVGALTPLPYDPKSGTRPTLGGVTYWYQVTAGTLLRLRGRQDHALFSLRIGQPPANDDFANRKTLTGATAADSVDMTYASWESTESGVDAFGPPSVWYRWVAPSTGRFVFDTKGQKFTRVAVYTGTSLTNLVAVGTNALYGYDPNAYDRNYLDATSGTEYVVQLKQASLSTGLDRINVRPFAAPANDNFASAINMTGSGWTTTGTDVDSTAQSGEPFISINGGTDGKTVWWKWTAPANGLFRISSAGSSVDTIMGVYTGTALGALTTIGTDASSGFGATGALVFKAVSGTTYYFMLDTQNRQEGALKLTLQPAVAAPNDAFANRLVLSGLALQTGGNVIAATVEAGEPSMPGATVGHSVWYEWVAPASGNAVFKVTAANFTPAVGIFSGTTLANLSPLVTSSGGGAATSAQTFQTSYPVSSGSSYKILVDGSPATNGLFQISINLAAAPANDAFESRYKLAGPVIHSSGNNLGATKQTGEPAHAGAAAANSIWWEWTAPASGPVTIDTADSVARPNLAVYTGTVLNALTAVAGDTTVFPETFSTVTFNATAGTKYQIAADSASGTRGDIALNLVTGGAVPANDAFATATVWNGDQQEALFYPQGATAEVNEPAPGGRPAARSLWWKWTPATARRASFWLETQSTTLLARLVIYKGDTLGNLTPILTQGADVHWQRSLADVLAGTTYYIVVDTPSGPVDPGWIKMGIEPVNGTSDMPALVDADTGAIVESTVGASTANTQVSPSSQRQLWFAWVAPVNARMDWHVTTPAGSGTSTSITTTGFSQGGVTVPVPGSNELLTTFDTVAGSTYFFQVTTQAPVPVTVQLTTAVRQVPPSNDLQNRALEMAGASWTFPLTLGAESGNRLFWSWIAPTSGVAEITLTGTLASTDALLAYADGQTPITAGASSTNGGAPVIRLASKAGQHWIIVSRTDFKRLRAATLSLAAASANIPTNDSYLSPQLLATNWTSATGDVTYASCEPGERDHSGRSGTGNPASYPPGRSVWFDWTPAASGPATLRLDTTGNLAMRLYSGPTLQQWADGDSLQSGSHVLSTYVIGGQTYHIAVATLPYDETTAPFTLRYASAAANDMVANAIALTGAGASSSVDSAGATVEVGEPGNGFDFNAIYGTLWWKWTAPSTGTVRMDTLGSGFDTVLAVFSSDLPDATARIAENDNATTRAGVTASAVSFPAVSGQSYLIRIAHQFPIGPNLTPLVTDITGTARLNISMSAAADPFARWLADYPTLNGASALETADPDRDGVSNLLELALGSNPTSPDAPHSQVRMFRVDGGWQAEAGLDRNAMDAISGGTPLEVSWQVSRDLVNWQPGPVSQFVRMDGVLSVERILLQPGEGNFVRLVVRKAR